MRRCVTQCQGTVHPHSMEVMMKRMLIAVGAMTLLMTGMAYAQAEPPVIDQQQMNQKQRIDQGIASGKLTEQEANLLNKE
jgi:opacity protein-like surface antigen